MEPIFTPTAEQVTKEHFMARSRERTDNEYSDSMEPAVWSRPRDKKTMNQGRKPQRSARGKGVRGARSNAGSKKALLF
jgi:hypothetical protein